MPNGNDEHPMLVQPVLSLEDLVSLQKAAARARLLAETLAAQLRSDRRQSAENSDPKKP